MTKWTNGPWVNGEHGIIQDGASSYQDRILVSGVRMPMGRDDEAEANANLIAAAPELYEVLSAFERCVDLWLPADEDVKEEHYGEAEALAGLHREMLRVLEKARGES